MIQWLELKKKGLSYPITWLKNRIAWEVEKRQRRLEDDTTTAGQNFQDTAIEAAFLESIANYPLKPWDGPLTLFRPPLVGKWQVAPDRLVNDDRDYLSPDNDWTEWAPKLEIHEVPGDHDSMVLEPNVRVLAARMRRSLEAADKSALSTPLRQLRQEAAE